MKQASAPDHRAIKADLRRSLGRLVPDDPDRASQAIVGHLVDLMGPDDCVLTFSAMPDEPNLSDLSSTGATFALTRTPDKGPLTVHFAGGPIERHRWGYVQPAAGSPTVEPRDISLALVPAVALGRDGSRLGHGMGYYDKLLPRLTRARWIGVAWECRIVDSLPMAEHDVFLDGVVTEEGLRIVEIPTKGSDR